MKILKVWITKYALTEGILEKEVIVCIDGLVKEVDDYSAYYFPTEYHIDKQSAIVKAEKMRANKIASLKMQIEKLENIKFE